MADDAIAQLRTAFGTFAECGECHGEDPSCSFCLGVGLELEAVEAIEAVERELAEKTARVAELEAQLAKFRAPLGADIANLSDITGELKAIQELLSSSPPSHESWRDPSESPEGVDVWALVPGEGYHTSNGRVFYDSYITRATRDPEWAGGWRTARASEDYSASAIRVAGWLPIDALPPVPTKAASHD